MSAVAIKRLSIQNDESHSVRENMSTLCKKISERAFLLFERSGCRHGHDIEDWLEAESEVLLAVPIELTETESEYSVKARVPGFSEKEIEIAVEPDQLLITGRTERQIEEKRKKTIYSEVFADEILRTVTMPSEIDPEKVTAKLKNGILEIFLPKATAKEILSVAQAA